MAEAVRFELTMDCSMPPFQGGALDRYATPPGREKYTMKTAKTAKMKRILAVKASRFLLHRDHCICYLTTFITGKGVGVASGSCWYAHRPGREIATTICIGAAN